MVSTVIGRGTAAPSDCLGLKKPCPCKTPQIVVALLGQAAAGVLQSL